MSGWKGLCAAVGTEDARESRGDGDLQGCHSIPDGLEKKILVEFRYSQPVL